MTAGHRSVDSRRGRGTPRRVRATSLRRARAATLAVAALCGVLALVGVGTAGPAAAAPVQAGNDRGFAQLTACLASGRPVSALFVVDESGSLVSNDPDGIRFKALEQAVGYLDDFARESGDKARVEVAEATFSDAYQPAAQLGGWTALGGQNGAQVAADMRARLERSWAASARGDTNYTDAIVGAMTDLTARGGRNACRAMVWFTDGLYDVGAGTDAAAVALCRPGGPVDDLRRAGISMLALALFTDELERRLTTDPALAPRRGELEAIATGGSAQRTCGTVPIPESSTAGVFLAADNAAALQGLFSAAIAQAGGGTATKPITIDPVTFTLDPGMRTFQVDMDLSGNATAVQVSSPDGRSVTVRADGTTQQTDLGTAVARQGDGFLSVRVEPPAPATPGTWTVDPTPKVLAARIYVVPDLKVVLDPPPAAGLTAGSSGTLTGRLVNATGDAPDLSLYRSVTVSATAAATGGGTVPVAVDQQGPAFTLTLTPPESAVTVNVAVAAAVTTASGVVLDPVQGSAAVPIVLAGAFPTTEPSDVLELGTAQGIEPARGTLTLVGSAEGPTKVCLGEAADVAAPERAGAVTLDYERGCTDLAQGQRLDVPVSATSTEGADGPGTATLPITITSAASDGRQAREVSRDLPVSWTLVRPVDQATRLWLIVLLLLLSIAVPLVLLFLVNRSLAKFSVSRPWWVTQVPVTVGRDGLRSRSGGALIPNDSGHDTQPPDGAVQGRLGDVPLRAAASRNPLAELRFEAMARPGTRLISGVGPRANSVSDDGRIARVTPGLQDQWLLEVRDDDLLDSGTDTPVPARVIMSMTSPGDADLRRAEADLRAALPNQMILAPLRSAAAEDRRKSAAGGGAGARTGTASRVGTPGPGLPGPGLPGSGVPGTGLPGTGGTGVRIGPPPPPAPPPAASAPPAASPRRGGRSARRHPEAAAPAAPVPGAPLSSPPFAGGSAAPGVPGPVPPPPSSPRPSAHPLGTPLGTPLGAPPPSGPGLGAPPRPGPTTPGPGSPPGGAPPLGSIPGPPPPPLPTPPPASDPPPPAKGRRRRGPR